MLKNVCCDVCSNFGNDYGSGVCVPICLVCLKAKDAEIAELAQQLAESKALLLSSDVEHSRACMELTAELEEANIVYTTMMEESRKAIDFLRLELEEAKRVNLRQRVEDLTFHAMLYSNADSSSMCEIFEKVFSVKPTHISDDDWGYDGDGEHVSQLLDDIVDWLIAQGVKT